MTELPTINNYSNVSQCYSGDNLSLGLLTTTRSAHAWPFENVDYQYRVDETKLKEFISANPPKVEKENKMAEKVGRRIVKVFIVDPSADVPLDKAIIYQGEESLTDSTDQELFFEVDIKALLQSHNVERAKYLDKKATKAAGKDVFLEEARIRDLIMMVTEIAKF